MRQDHIGRNEYAIGAGAASQCRHEILRKRIGAFLHIGDFERLRESGVDICHVFIENIGRKRPPDRDSRQGSTGRSAFEGRESDDAADDGQDEYR